MGSPLQRPRPAEPNGTAGSKDKPEKQELKGAGIELGAVLTDGELGSEPCLGGGFLSDGSSMVPNGGAGETAGCTVRRQGEAEVGDRNSRVHRYYTSFASTNKRNQSKALKTRCSP